MQTRWPSLRITYHQACTEAANCANTASVLFFAVMYLTAFPYIMSASQTVMRNHEKGGIFGHIRSPFKHVIFLVE